MITISESRIRIIVAAPADGIQDPYLAILNLTTSEYLKLYNKEIIELPESDRYDLTRSKWTDFYQELEVAVSKFQFTSAVKIFTLRYVNHSPTEPNNVISPTHQ